MQKNSFDFVGKLTICWTSTDACILLKDKLFRRDLVKVLQILGRSNAAGPMPAPPLSLFRVNAVLDQSAPSIHPWETRFGMFDL